MTVRRARPSDFPFIRKLAGTLDLDYPDMDNDRFWVAEDAGDIFGIVGLKKRPDCDELVGLGVDPSRRGTGLGLRLVEALLAEAPGDVVLATVIPGFFARCGFAAIPNGPPGMAKDAAWCAGCDRERCTVMIWKKP